MRVVRCSMHFLPMETSSEIIVHAVHKTAVNGAVLWIPISYVGVSEQTAYLVAPGAPRA